MKSIIKIALLSSVLFFSFQASKAQNSLYNLNTVQKIKIYLSQTNWDYQMDTAKYGADGYIMADSVVINGTRLDSIGVKYKGNSSYDSTRVKNPFTISTDQYKSQTYDTYKTLKLANCYKDPSMIREVLAYNILKNYMHCPKANFAEVYVNDKYFGLYSNVENINKNFCATHFGSKKNTFIKCCPLTVASPTSKSNLKYLSADSSAYANYYEMESDYGWNDLTALANTITNSPGSIASVVDIDRLLWMLAFDNTLVNLDSYMGVFCQNYFLYKDNSGIYNPVVWDLNMSFGGFPYAGSSATSMGTQDTTGLQQLSPTLHSTDAYWPMIKAVMSNSSYKIQYIAHMKTILDEMISNKYYITLADSIQKIAESSVLADTNKFYSDSAFYKGLTSAVYDSYYIPGISSLMDARNTYLKSNSLFSVTAPTLSSVSLSNSSPILNDSIYFTVTATNASSVTFGIRFATTDHFTKYSMYDDGLHNDGTAGDGVFGVKALISGTSAQYYFEAENSNAAVFLPARAEYEYYSLTATTTGAPTAGEIVINEFMASNTSGITNESGKYPDWIELYNTTAKTLDLSSMYLTDDFSNTTKSSFLSGTTIAPHSYLTILADEGTTSSSVIHAAFKLSASGEKIMLSDGLGTVIDSVSFGAQTDNISLGRCPNGTGSFSAQSSYTFGTENNCSSAAVVETESDNGLIMYPVPANNILNIKQNNKSSQAITIINSMGEVIYKDNLIDDLQINTSAWPNGIYLIQQGRSAKKLIIIH